MEVFIRFPQPKDTRCFSLTPTGRLKTPVWLGLPYLPPQTPSPCDVMVHTASYWLQSSASCGIRDVMNFKGCDWLLFYFMHDELAADWLGFVIRN